MRHRKTRNVQYHRQLYNRNRNRFCYHYFWLILRVLQNHSLERVNGNGSNRPPVPWVESSPCRNWVEWTWIDLEKCQVQGRQHIDFDPSPFDPIRPKLFDQKGRPNSFRPISFDPFHAIQIGHQQDLKWKIWIKFSRIYYQSQNFQN